MALKAFDTPVSLSPNMEAALPIRSGVSNPVTDSRRFDAIN
jgi:hypothetical protein